MIITQLIIGWLATIITACSTIPQVIKTFKSKTPGTASFTSFWILWIGSLSWIIYALAKTEHSYILLFASSFDFIIQSTLLFLFYKYSKNPKFIFLKFFFPIIVVTTILSVVIVLTKNWHYPNIWFTSIFINIASFCISFAFAPQIIKTLLQKKINGISLFYKIIGITIEALWLTYWLLAGIMNIYKIDGGESIEFGEMIQVLIWAIFALTINIAVVILILIWDQTYKKKNSNFWHKNLKNIFKKR